MSLLMSQVGGCVIGWVGGFFLVTSGKSIFCLALCWWVSLLGLHQGCVVVGFGWVYVDQFVGLLGSSSFLVIAIVTTTTQPQLNST